jgi:hypothetical protein
MPGEPAVVGNHHAGQLERPVGAEHMGIVALADAESHDPNMLVKRER